MKNNITQIMQKVIQHAETFTGNGVPFPGIPTGYADLDAKLPGFQPGDPEERNIPTKVNE